MVTVNGRFNSAVDGIIYATPTAPFADPSNPGVLIVRPYEAPIINGIFSIDVNQSEELSIDNSPTEVVSYKWEAFEEIDELVYLLPDGTVYEGFTHTFEGQEYTGLTHDENSILLFPKNETTRNYIVRPFFASAPNLDTINFEELIGIPINLEHINISLHALAKLLIENDTYRNVLTTQLNLVGEYDPEIVYQLGDVVRRNGNSYYYINDVNGSAEPPAEGDDENWFLLVEKGDPGGTGAQTIGYDPNSWGADPIGSEASSRKDVSEAVEALRESTSTVDLSNYLTKEEGAPRNNPVFTGSAKRSIMEYPINVADRPTELVTAQYVQAALATTSTGFFPKPLIYARRVRSFPIVKDTPTKITWDNRITNPDEILDQTGGFRLPKSSIYRIEFKLILFVSSTDARQSVVSNFRVYVDRIFPNTQEICTLKLESATYNPNSGNVNNQGVTWYFELSGFNYINNSLGDVHELKIMIVGNRLQRTGHVGAFSGLNYNNDGYHSNNYIRIWEEAP